MEYTVIDPNHSFCSRPFPDAVEQQMSSSEQAHILQLHNYERRLVRGTNMEKMVNFIVENSYRRSLRSPTYAIVLE